MPIFKDLGLLFGFVLLMLAAGTVVAAGTQLATTLGRMRARYLRLALVELLAQIDRRHLSLHDARQLASILLRHPWLSGRSNSCARSLGREDFVRLLVEIAADSSPVAGRLRDAFGFACAERALALSQSIGRHALLLEQEHPGESARSRDIKAILLAAGPHPLIASVHAWYGHAMARATHRYMRRTRIITTLLSLALVLALRLDTLELLDLHAAVGTVAHWPGLALSWLLISLGTPFWYDRLKDLLHFRPSST